MQTYTTRMMDKAWSPEMLKRYHQFPATEKAAGITREPGAIVNDPGRSNVVASQALTTGRYVNIQA